MTTESANAQAIHLLLHWGELAPREDVTWTTGYGNSQTLLCSLLRRAFAGGFLGEVPKSAGKVFFPRVTQGLLYYLASWRERPEYDLTYCSSLCKPWHLSKRHVWTVKKEQYTYYRAYSYSMKRLIHNRRYHSYTDILKPVSPSEMVERM